MRCFFLYFDKGGHKVEGRGEYTAQGRYQGIPRGRVSFLMESGKTIERHSRIPHWWSDPLSVACKFAEWNEQQPKTNPEPQDLKLEIQKCQTPLPTKSTPKQSPASRTTVSASK